jgi:hypothetical protein
MPGVPRELIEHELHLDPKVILKQQLLHFAQDKKDIIKREIVMLDIEFIKCTTQIGLPIPSLYLKRIKIG